MPANPLRTAVIAGGSGLIGSRLADGLVRSGVQTLILSRRPQTVRIGEGRSWEELPTLLERADAIFNLAGESIGDHRWSRRQKQIILESRLQATNRIVEALGACRTRPSVLVNASAVGFYGARDAQPVDESTTQGSGFLAEVCHAWEQAADAALSWGVRVVKLRTAVVLATEGGALPRMLASMRHTLGLPLGSGQQGFSWIHIQDHVRLLMEAASQPAFQGAINASAPGPVSNEAFTRALACRLGRPCWKLPSSWTRLALWILAGEMGEELLLKGAFVYPRKALRLGFRFQFERIEEALVDLTPDVPSGSGDQHL